MHYQTLHSWNLELIKKIVKASFVGWIREKDKLFLRIVIDKKENLIPFPQGKTITEETYTDLINKLCDTENYTQNSKNQENSMKSSQE